MNGRSAGGGRLLRGKQPWTVLSLPAVAVGPERWPLRSGVVHTREKGDVLAPAIDSREVLLARMMDIGAYNFSAQYQQSPFKTKEPDGMRGGCFAGPDDPKGLPGRWFGRISERAIMAHEVFGIGDAFFDGGWSCQGHGPRALHFFLC